MLMTFTVNVVDVLMLLSMWAIALWTIRSKIA